MKGHPEMTDTAQPPFGIEINSPAIQPGRLVAIPANISKGELASLHLEEWQIFRSQILIPAMQDSEESKKARDIASAIKIAQEAEAKAHERYSADNQNQADSIITVKWES